MFNDPHAGDNNMQSAPQAGPTFEELAGYIQQQVAAALAQQPAAAAPALNLKPAKPRIYSADRNDDPDVWLFQFDQYADIVHLSDTDRVKLAATFLAGPAGVWWRATVIGLKQLPPPDNMLTWPQFKQRLIHQFKPVDSAKIARDRLAELKQIGSVMKYNNDFNRLMLEAGNVGPVEALDRYTRGLKRDIRMEVDLAGVTTLQEAQAKAQRVDSITWTSRAPYAYNNNRSSVVPPPNGYAPMDLSVIQADKQEKQDIVVAMSQQRSRAPKAYHAPPLSKEEYERCRREGLCLKCKKSGHTARFCLANRPENKPSGNGRAR
jgi:hypothetical protein